MHGAQSESMAYLPASSIRQVARLVSFQVATYDLKPEMSSEGVADKVVEQIKLKKHPFVMCNFAPPDMVGHTGVGLADIATGLNLRS